MGNGPDRSAWVGALAVGAFCCTMVLMAENIEAPYAPGTYTKGAMTKVAETPADAVKLVWDGYVRESGDTDTTETLGEDAFEPVDGETDPGSSNTPIF